MKIAVFGGTFDPVHNGHIAMLESFAREPYIDKILVVPTYISPHKTEADIVSARIVKLRLIVK